MEKATALKNYEHAGLTLLEKGETYEVKKKWDRFFYNGVLIPEGILTEVKEAKDIKGQAETIEETGKQNE